MTRPAILIASFALLIVVQAKAAHAEGPWLLTPVEGSERIPHPFFGVTQGIPRQAFFAASEHEGLRVYCRMTSYETDHKLYTAVTFVLDNENPTLVRIVRPTLDLINGDGQVLPIMSYQTLLAAARASTNSQPQSESFFAYGSQRFVAQATAGYAIGSLLGELVRSSQGQKISKAAEHVEKYWLKDEYRIPPSAHVAAYVVVTGKPRLPLTARLSVDRQVFAFRSVTTDEETSNNVAIEANGGYAGPTQGGAAVPEAYVPNQGVPPATKTNVPDRGAGVVGTASKYSYSAEQIAKANGCPAPTATMSYAAPGVEAFTVTCGSGEPMSIRCEFGQCRTMK